MESSKILSFNYLNWKNIESKRFVIPQSITFTSNEYHPTPEWLMKAYDLERKALRTFSLKKIKKYYNVPIKKAKLHLADKTIIPSYPQLEVNKKLYPIKGDLSCFDSFKGVENQVFDVNVLAIFETDKGFMPNPMVNILGANILFIELDLQ